MTETKTGNGNVPADLAVSKTSALHERNKELRYEYLELEEQAKDPAVSPHALRRIKLRQERVLDQVMRENAGLVGQFVGRFSKNNTTSAEDYSQEGNLAMLEAWLQWDPTGAPFASYAWHSVKGKVQRVVQRTEHPNKSYADWSNIPDIRVARTMLEETLGRTPTVEEIAQATGISVANVMNATVAIPKSLDAVLDDADGGSLYDVVSDATSKKESFDIADTALTLDDDKVLRATRAVPARALASWLLHNGFAGTDKLAFGLVAFVTGLDRETSRRLTEGAHATIQKVIRNITKGWWYLVVTDFVPTTQVSLDDLAAIDELRNVTNEQFRPTLEQVVTICNDIFMLLPADETAERTKLSRAQLIEVVAQLGTWLSRSSKKHLPTEVVLLERTQQTALHQPAIAQVRERSRRRAKVVEQEGFDFTVPDTVAIAPPKKKRKRAKRKGYLKVGNTTVLLPEGYQKSSEQSRNIRKALASIVTREPSRRELARFLSRIYPAGEQALRGELVFLVWQFATLGRLSEMRQINTDPRFQRSVAHAYDLINLALVRAREGIATLTNLSVTDETALRDACAKAHFVAEREIVRITALLDDGTEQARELLALERQSFALKAHRNVPSNIAALNEGQVRRIVAASGLNIEAAPRSDTAPIRQQLAEIGLESDADQLVPQALNAALRGAQETFFDIMRDRVAGDPFWQERVAELLATPATASAFG